MIRTGRFAALGLCLLLATLIPASAGAENPGWLEGGHLKYRFTWVDYPQNSVFRELLGSGSISNSLEARLKFSGHRGNWDFNVDYQGVLIHSDLLQLESGVPGYPTPLNRVINDDRRWWDLTWSVGDDKTALIHRLDRLNVGYTTERTAWRFGRQAISWGNGLIFTPMDVFNPFDPAAVDKEYKTGDDMLYGQYLFDSGNDLQGVAIVRRNPQTGNVDADQSSLAFKYHGFLGENEIDLLAAQHYDDQIFGIGGITNVGGAVWRGDLTWTRTDSDKVFSAVTSLSYSWTWAGHNVSGILEYYYNGFGQKSGRYSVQDLLQNPDLLQRLERGELFTLARHYVAASASVEMNPLLILIPNLFVNLQDPSALAQLVVQYDWKQNLQVLAALNVPVGPKGSEYGGIEAPVEGLYFSTGPSVFAQLAWYF